MGHLARSISSRCPKVRGKCEKETHHRHVLKTKEGLVTKVGRCLNLSHYHHVFDTDAIFTVGVVTRFCAHLDNI